MSENARRLAIQLRRMKDRSGLGVPTIAARTAQSTQAWEQYLNGAKVPPRDAVEALGQLCGADYDRLGALWELAERGGGTHVPDPDPLDPLSPAEGLPRAPRWSRFRPLFVTVTGLALGGVLGLLILAGMTGDAGGGKRADGGGTETTAPPASSSSSSSSAWPGTQHPRTLPAATARTASGAAQAMDPDAAATASVGASGSAAPPATASATTSATAGPTSSASASASASGSASASASATSSGGLCLGVLILNVCIGG
ncbi:helix-turn-helix domain-containing protein [Streptomyces sp. NBC_01262]|uniref:helix-turn-helix domain-containing protein n=1 Tax=Streptomyces sp. NBC_01262 TaxID=2903803 RepID=UPI002E329F5F|nr:helix-turn-helix transcriptional regulator [Streptomyces sp. NBC_01262]